MAISDIALKEVGYKEGANNANKYSAALKKPAESWCADFVVWCAEQAGQSDVILHSSYCPDFENWAVKNHLIVTTPQKDDLVLFNWDGGKVAEHIGIVISYDPKTKTINTVEGNTGDGGNQSNGDGVYTKHRASSFVVAIIRPKWKQ
jgi:hypothetical protein